MPHPLQCCVCGASTLSPTRGHRGNCSPCYRRHRGEVLAGQTTWAELEAAGRALAVPTEAMSPFKRRKKTGG